MEARCQVYRNLILDNNLVVPDELKDEWKHGFSDPNFSIRHSKTIQTDLTADLLANNEQQFIILQTKLIVIIKFK